MANKWLCFASVSWFSWSRDRDAPLAIKKKKGWSFFAFSLSPFCFAESGWKSLLFVACLLCFRHSGGDKQHVCPIPFATYCFHSHLSFPDTSLLLLQVCLPGVSHVVPLPGGEVWWHCSGCPLPGGLEGLQEEQSSDEEECGSMLFLGAPHQTRSKRSCTTQTWLRVTGLTAPSYLRFSSNISKITVSTEGCS